MELARTWDTQSHFLHIPESPGTGRDTAARTRRPFDLCVQVHDHVYIPPCLTCISDAGARSTAEDSSVELRWRKAVCSALVGCSLDDITSVDGPKERLPFPPPSNPTRPARVKDPWNPHARTACQIGLIRPLRDIYGSGCLIRHWYTAGATTEYSASADSDLNQS